MIEDKVVSHQPCMLMMCSSLQGNLNDFANQISCQQACIAGTPAPTEAASTGQISIPAPTDLVFLATALTTKSWLTLDATSVSYLPFDLLLRLCLYDPIDCKWTSALFLRTRSATLGGLIAFQKGYMAISK